MQPRDVIARQYADERHLETRRSIYRHRTPPLDLTGEVLDRLGAVTGTVVDVGTGPGLYARRLRATRPELTVLALDLSPGMVAAAGPPGVVADATALPLPDASCGAALALHMLYHVPDPAAAVAELARVRRDDGVVLITTNAAADKAELGAAFRSAVADVTGAPDGWDESSHFTLEYAEQLARTYFAHVERYDHRGDVVVTDPDEVVGFVESTRDLYAHRLPFDAVLARLGTAVRRTVAERGAYRFTSHVGLLVCR